MKITNKSNNIAIKQNKKLAFCNIIPKIYSNGDIRRTTDSHNRNLNGRCVSSRTLSMVVQCASSSRNTCFMRNAIVRS